jgi:hypothetical protein
MWSTKGLTQSIVFQRHNILANFKVKVKTVRVKCQYNETNAMYFSFILLRIKGLYMFRALLAHPQEVLLKRHLVYFVRIMSVGCGTVAVYQMPFV